MTVPNIAHHGGSGRAAHEAPNGGVSNGDGEDVYDLICVGFGPASLAIAVALYDRELPVRVLFLERQPLFAWHSGMLLPGTRMQISFMKDLATLRNPRSEFTFLNYLHRKKRLVSFTNLGTFLPLREEYNDYMSWAASHFTDCVRYSTDVLSVSAVASPGPVRSWSILTTHLTTGLPHTFRTRNVVLAVGGRPKYPSTIAPSLPHPRLLHSSHYSTTIRTLLPSPDGQYRVAVVGGGQSAAEIFHDLQTRYPSARTSLFIRAHALKPSDDSPFVNEIFDPERVDTVFSLAPEARKKALAEDKATNYSVVRPALLDEMYSHQYAQRLRESDERMWAHRIHPLREVVGVENVSDADGDGEGEGVVLKLRNTRTGECSNSEDAYDAVIFGTGYERETHLTMLKPVKAIMKDGQCSVDRQYRVVFREGAVAKDACVFLQGCCEESHGVSSTPPRNGEVRQGEVT